MPLDRAYDYSHGSFYWYEKFAWLPKKCVVTKKRIWLRKGMAGFRMVTGPGEPVIIIQWMDSKQFLIERLKGKV